MTNSPISESVFLKAFAVLMLGSMVAGFLAGAIAGFLLGLVLALTGGNMANLQTGAAILGGVAGVVVSYFVFRTVVLKLILPKLPAASMSTIEPRVV